MSRQGGRIRVVFLLQHLSFGGSQTQALELARGLDAARFQASLWTLMDGLELWPQARGWGLEVRRLGRGGHVWPAALARLAVALRKERPDLLLLYTGIPNIWGRLLGRFQGGPVIVATCRGSLGPRRQKERRLWRLADHHICNARWLKQLLARGSGVDPARVSVIANGVDVERFRPAAEHLDGQPPVVLGLGRMSGEKGQDLLLRAFALIAGDHPQARLWLAGDGPLWRRLRDQAQASPHGGRIKVLPATADVPGLLRQAAVLALPSLHEGMPNVVLEAMAAGLPVLASRLGGVAEVVRHGQTGLLLPPEEAPAWAAAMGLLLDNPELARSWGQAGRRRAEKEFSLGAMVRAHQELFERLLDRRGR